MTTASRLEVQSGFQEKVHMCTADIAVIGGAMGAGKSYALILEVMKHIKDPHFRCGIFRKNRANIFMSWRAMGRDSANCHLLPFACQDKPPRIKDHLSLWGLCSVWPCQSSEFQAIP